MSDGSRPYQAAIAQYLPDARHVLDRFHVVRWFTQGLTHLRREIQRRDPHRRPPTFEPDLFRARFTLLRRADHLTEAHQAHLDWSCPAFVDSFRLGDRQGSWGGDGARFVVGG